MKFLFLTVAALIITLVVGPLLSKPLAGLLIAYHRPTILVDFGNPASPPGCMVYLVAIEPKYFNRSITDIDLKLYFPNDIVSYGFATDQTFDGKISKLNGNFHVSYSCTVSAPPGDLPSDTQIRKIGQSQRELQINLKELSKSSGLAMMVSIQPTEVTNISINGGGSYTAWGQQLPAGVEAQQVGWPPPEIPTPH